MLRTGLPCRPVCPARQLQVHHVRPCQRRRHRSIVVNSVLEVFGGLGNFLRPEVAAMFSAVLAVGSVGLNYYGSVATESKRVELQKEVEREQRYRQQTAELQSIIARYRGPLLESSIDLEQRLYHLATMTGEWFQIPHEPCYEEITYTMFTLAQLLGFLEVVRREGPRERGFLQVGNPTGSDTLATLVEGLRFVLCASPATLAAWGNENGLRDHPGARHRMPYVPRKGKRRAMAEADCEVPLRISRGRQRGIGALMVVTPMGAERHYTRTYAEFVQLLREDPVFAEWLQPVEADLVQLLTGNSWMGAPAFPLQRWTRVLLLQQLLVDAVDLLDPDYVRVPESRRVRLMPVTYGPLPNVEEYKMALSAVSKALDPYHGDVHFDALQNLMRPATSRPAALNGNSGGSSGGSLLGSTSSSDEADGSNKGGGLLRLGAPILPLGLLPSVGASGVLLPGQGQEGRPSRPASPVADVPGAQRQQQQQQQEASSSGPAAEPLVSGTGGGNGRAPSHLDNQ